MVHNVVHCALANLCFDPILIGAVAATAQICLRPVLFCAQTSKCQVISLGSGAIG